LRLNYASFNAHKKAIVHHNKAISVRGIAKRSAAMRFE
jgi:hypothetical protein